MPAVRRAGVAATIWCRCSPGMASPIPASSPTRRWMLSPCGDTSTAASSAGVRVIPGCPKPICTTTDSTASAPAPPRNAAAHSSSGLTTFKAFWQSPEGRQIKTAEQADDSELQAWLADQHGVSVHSHGGLCLEEWTGEVDGHSFYFRERHAEWRIELDLRRPAGASHPRIVAGTDNYGATRYEARELDQGDVIAYGTTSISRATAPRPWSGHSSSSTPSASTWHARHARTTAATCHR